MNLYMRMIQDEYVKYKELAFSISSLQLQTS